VCKILLINNGMQRIIDIVLACVICFLIAPIIFPIIIVLRFTGEGYVFYRQDRIGLHGRRFGLLKFATMLRDSPALGAGEITLKNDPRILPIGSFLRKTKINELPQLINVIFGDMSFVGPRPMVPKTFNKYPNKSKRTIISVRPGITGVGSIFFRDEERYLGSGVDAQRFYEQVIIPYKSELECWYVGRASIGFYFLLLFLTVWVICFPGNSRVLKWLRGSPVVPAELQV
jgi:lipopolysaccharide/colanic/teichoic acid biosynthesis glycosyltransferase